jgi:hypothetical protein
VEYSADYGHISKRVRITGKALQTSPSTDQSLAFAREKEPLRHEEQESTVASESASKEAELMTFECQ